MGNVGNVEVGLGKGASKNRLLLLCSDNREELLWFGHIKCPLVPGC